MAIWNTIQFLKSCFQWESTLISTVAFVVRFLFFIKKKKFRLFTLSPKSKGRWVLLYLDETEWYTFSKAEVYTSKET